MVDTLWQKRISSVIQLIKSLDKKNTWAQNYWSGVLEQLKIQGKTIDG